MSDRTSRKENKQTKKTPSSGAVSCEKENRTARGGLALPPQITSGSIKNSHRLGEVSPESPGGFVMWGFSQNPTLLSLML